MSAEKYRTLLKWLIGLLVALLATGLLIGYAVQKATGQALGPDSLLGWAVPLAVLFIIVAVSWFLLAQERPVQPPEQPYVSCPVCGQAISKAWRMCPYCGARSSASAAVEQASGGE